MLLSDIVVMETFVPFAPIHVMWPGIAIGEVIRFDDAGAVVTADDTVARLEFPVPYRAGMTELVVERASARVSGRRIDTAPVTVPKATASSTVDLNGRPGGLRQVDLHGLAVTDPGTTDVVLVATSGSPGRYRWHLGDDGVERSTSGSGDALHLMVRAKAGGGFGPPVTAAPSYGMPDNNAGLYGPVLAGASLRLDTPVTGAARLTFSPAVDAVDVQLFLGVDRGTSLPHEAQAVNWTATEVSAVWASAPTAVVLTATAGGPEPVTVADLPGEMSATATDLDFTPGARALLGEAYSASAGDDLMLAVEATSETAGELVASALDLVAHYRLDSVAGEGAEVVLRGSPQHVPVPIAAGLVPAQLVLTVDGRFGPGVRVAGSDEADLPGRRRGVRLDGAVLVARRVTLTTEERARPLLRVSVYGRADEPTELILTLCPERNGRPGPPLGEPVALQVDPALDPAWHRADLPVPTPPAGADAVWVQAEAPTGRFWWFADPAPTGVPATATASADGGTTSSSIAAQPLAQVHYVTERPEPGRLRLLGPGGVLAEDLLALPAERSRIETTRLDAHLRELAAPPSPDGPDSGVATALAAPALVADAGSGTSVSFRKEAVQPIAGATALAALAALGESLDLAFDCARDADFRVLDVTLRYDPWTAA